MSNLDQCPSTTKGEKQRPGKQELAAIAGTPGTIQGQRAWRSLDEVADTGEFRDFLEREFPAGASELSRAEDDDAVEQGGESRRNFLKLMGASVALAGAATIPGCRRPDHKILAYSREVPEEIIPGKPLFYATSFPRPDGGAEGLLVETHEGRPTKIEGNPLHPMNQGKPSIWAMASIMGLYDPDRLKNPVFNNTAQGKRLDATWDDFRHWADQNLNQFEGNGGEGLAVLADKKTSPSRYAAIAAFKQKFPKAMWVPYRPAEMTGSSQGTAMAFGVPMREVLKISKENTGVIVSLDRDFLHKEPGEVAHSRQFAATRLVLSTKDTMSRLYCVESGFSLTGAQADHRMRLAPSQVTAFARALAALLLPKLNAPELASALSDVSFGDAESRRFVEECAKDLLDRNNDGRSLIVCGESQPPEVHALVVAMNAALGNVGKSVAYLPLSEEEAAPSAAGIKALTEAMRAGTVKALVCLNTNPLYDAPGDLDFEAAFAKVPVTITHSVESTETAAASTWSLNGAHYLESWGDTQSHDGTIAPVQPMIAPLYEPAMSDLEFITFLSDRKAEKVDGYEVVRGAWAKLVQGDLEAQWRRALHDGVLANTQQTTQAPRVNMAGVGAGLARLTGAPKGLEVVFDVGYPGDGRYANVSWLQELPNTGTRVVWDNPMLMSPATAKNLEVEPLHYRDEKFGSEIYTKSNYPYARMATVEIEGRSVTGPVWVLPGMADNTVILTLGYGRRNAGLVGDGVGVNFYKVRSSTGSGGFASGVAQRAPGEHMIASTQNHWSMEGRTSIVRAVDLPRYQKFGDSVYVNDHGMYGTAAALNFGEQLGELTHTPPNVSIYENPYNRSKADPIPTLEKEETDAQKQVLPTPYTTVQQWAMTIDQTTCTGCGACTLACQAENNIPVVGKKETAKGREMTWIRVDRYYTGEDINNPTGMYHQPVACVHCENAPCETVCPVNATVHGPEGLNYMTYNRCIGTRYCANNCPYKVRRFNFFDYGVTKFNGGYHGKGLIEAIAPDRGGITGSGLHNEVNPNLIPPRLRQKLDEIARMQKNPNVTVRSRGVMEKCSYCVQRINAARIECKLENLEHVPDGFFQTACQQACPTNAIVFGDQNLAGSRVKAMRDNNRSYLLLGYLNTRPRTSHMVRVANPKRELCDQKRVDSWDEPLVHHGAHEGGHDHDGHTHSPTDQHSYHVNPTRQSKDRGYAVSLRVLGARA